MTHTTKKTLLGQFYTRNNFWLKKHILDFIKSTKTKIAFDPFAGDGDLLKAFKEIGYKKVLGYDIDPSLKWVVNDSLLNIPKIKNSLIITNPPYLTNYSAKRKKIYESVKKYFETCSYDDLYQLSIEKCLSNDYGVMIVPETFINSNFPKNRLVSITIIEEMLFHDTENPICVICFDNNNKSFKDILIYKNENKIGTLEYFEKMRKTPHNKIPIKFNSREGNIALRAVDTTDEKNPIRFMKVNEINYDLKNIKHSSRLITIIKISIEKNKENIFIKNSNIILNKFRNLTKDVLLSPFKGNNKNGKRRRRLDYKTARAILEEAYKLTYNNRLPF